MAAISSGQLIARPLSLRTRAAAVSALSLAGLAAGTGGAAWAGSLAAAGRADALCPDRAILAVFWRVRLGEAFFLAVMMLLPGTSWEPGSAPAALPHQGQHSYLAGGTGSRQFRENSAFSSRSGMSPNGSPRDGRPAA